MELIERRLSNLASGLKLTRDIGFYDVYDVIQNDNLRMLMAYCHTNLNYYLDLLNDGIRTSIDENGNVQPAEGYYHAEDSRGLISIIKQLDSLMHDCGGTSFAFEICNESYLAAIDACRIFLKPSGGTVIPKTMTKTPLENVHPIFKMGNVIESKPFHPILEPIGEGGYAKVFSYLDPIYQIPIVLKRAKPDLDEKELKRFKREYEVLKELKSPYIIEVYGYNDEKHEYTMEKMDENIRQLISRRANNPISISERRKIINQLGKGLSYIHDKGYMHRDISPNNAFIKNYDGIYVAKLGDFGLVKIPDSSLTTTYTSVKGSFIDPKLRYGEFKKFEKSHDIYAFTILCLLILTWKNYLIDFEEGSLNDFYMNGTNHNLKTSFKTVDDLIAALKLIPDEEIEKIGRGDLS